MNDEKSPLNIFNTVVCVLSLLATLYYWWFMFSDPNNVLPPPDLLNEYLKGWSNIYLDAFLYISLAPSIAFAAYILNDLTDKIEYTVLGYIGAVIIAFLLTIPMLLVWGFVSLVIFLPLFFVFTCNLIGLVVWGVIVSILLGFFGGGEEVVGMLFIFKK